MSFELADDDPWVKRGYGQAHIEPATRPADSFSNGFRTLVPEDCVGDQGRDAHLSNLRDVHRRYAEVTTADEVLTYRESVREPAGDRP